MQVLSIGLVVVAAVHAITVVALVVEHRFRRLSLPAVGGLVLLGGVAGSQLATRIGPPPTALWWAAVVTGVVATYCWWRRRDLRPAGAAAWSSLLVLGTTSAGWGVVFLATVPVSGLTRGLMWLSVPVMVLALPSTVITQREALEALLRHRWHRQSEPDIVADRSAWPFVSIQVPCHAEPPDIVIATLDHLSRLDYPAFEVLVIDNNTAVAELWQPVEEHCRRLGSRFRFLHVEGLTGAKAGAMNWASQFIDPSTELIGVVDADYHVDPAWLRSTIGFFDDTEIGFVQPPHAYRDWEDRRFGRMANWEYSVFFQTGMVALQEHGAGITVGTMSVIRRSALEAANGWAEWCQTEDSELAIRIHDVGFRSVYLREPLGWGLIPDTFAGYRKQRYRWTYGPVQELRHHWTRMLPRALGGSSNLGAGEKIHHANHGLDVAMVGVRLALWPLAAAVVLSMILHGEDLPTPFAIWVASTVVLVTSAVLRWLTYCHVTKAPLSGAFGAIVAYQGLSLTISLAALRALLGRPVPWTRTDKFGAHHDLVGALRTTRVETALAAACALAAAGGLIAGAGGMVRMLSIGFATQALTYACAPITAVVANHDIARSLRNEHQPPRSEPSDYIAELHALLRESTR